MTSRLVTMIRVAHENRDRDELERLLRIVESLEAKVATLMRLPVMETPAYPGEGTLL